MSRQYTTEEVREKFLKHLAVIADYWDTVPQDKTQRERIHGAIFSTLATLDGCSPELPGFIVAPIPCKEDKPYLQDNEENWFPENHEIEDQIQCDIGGGLHEVFHRYELDKKPKK